MLTNLKIQNLAIIENAELEFGTGLNVLTGETGAGKSIIVNALAILIGRQAENDLIKSNAQEAIVEAIFYYPKAIQIKEAENYLDHEDYLIVYKKIIRGKSNITRLNGQAVTLKQLKKITAPLLEITGQHDTQLLFDTTYQRILLDNFGANDINKSLIEYQNMFYKLQAIEKELQELLRNKNEVGEKKDFIEFQIKDINEHNFTQTEGEELNQQRLKAKNTHLIQTNLQKLSQNFQNIKTAMNTSQKAAKELEKIESFYKELNDFLTEKQIDIEEYLGEINKKLIHFNDLENLDIDYIESRLDLIFKYKTKYKVQTIKELIFFKNQLENKLNDFEFNSEKIDALELKKQVVSKQTVVHANNLHQKRKEYAKKLENYVQNQMQDLSFGQNKFKVDFQIHETLHPHGIDNLTFLISTNPGEPVKPIHKIASGGELSRLMLILKTIPSSYNSSCIIFDELDTGIGGITANRIGKKIKQISANNQVICITHLPQIARCADHHFLVEKATDLTSTNVAIKKIDGKQKSQELHRMIGGKELSTLINTKAS